MADGNAAPEPSALGQIGDEVGVEAGGIVAGIDVHVDIDIEPPRQLENAVDLAGVIEVVVGRRADHMSTHLQPLDQGGIGRRRRRQSLLREDAEFEIDRPGVVFRQLLQRLDALDAHWCIDLDVGADACRPVLEAAFQRRLSALIDVLDRKACLDGLHPAHVVGLAAARLRLTAIDDARLVQVDVGLDEPGAAQAALGVVD